MGCELDLDILSNHKISKDGTADFIDSYIPVKENTGNSFDKITLNGKNNMVCFIHTLITMFFSRC